VNTASSGSSSTAVATDIQNDKKSIHLLVAEISKDHQMLRADRNKFYESMESSEDGSSKTSSLKTAIKALKTKLHAAVSSLKVARMDLRKDEGHHISTASALHGTGTASPLNAGTHPTVHPVVHPVVKK
jgi:hypothetical protein